MSQLVKNGDLVYLLNVLDNSYLTINKDQNNITYSSTINNTSCFIILFPHKKSQPNLIRLVEYNTTQELTFLNSKLTLAPSSINGQMSVWFTTSNKKPEDWTYDDICGFYQNGSNLHISNNKNLWKLVFKERVNAFTLVDQMKGGVNVGEDIMNLYTNTMMWSIDEPLLDNVVKLGFNTVRYPVGPLLLNKHYFIIKDDITNFPTVKFDQTWLDRVSMITEWMSKRSLIVIKGIALALDNANPLLPIPLPLFWGVLSEQWKNDSNKVIFEIYNEPHRQDEEIKYLNEIGLTIAVIRAKQQSRTIMIGGPEYNSIDGLHRLPIQKDANIMYTIHNYDPFSFTHAPFPLGANFLPNNTIRQSSWPFNTLNNNSLNNAINLSVNTNLSASASVTYVYRNNSIESLNNDFSKTANYVQGRPVLLGEFGCSTWAPQLGSNFPVAPLDQKSHEQSRVRWINAMVSACKTHGFAYTYFDFHAGYSGCTNRFAVWDKEHNKVISNDVLRVLVT
jgi:aryl-phospho-beta-D-glucosidase BglC (GH1 family)